MRGTAQYGKLALAAIILVFPRMACAAGQTDYVLASDPASERAHSIRHSGSKLEKCGGQVGLRDERYVCRTTPIVVQEPRNLALNVEHTGFPHPSASSTSPGYDLWGPIDGTNITWTNASSDEGPSYWDLDFGRPTLIGKIYLKTWKGYPLKDFDILAWDGSDWSKPIATCRGNTGVLLTFPKLDVTTNRLRVLCINGPDHQGIFRRIEEFAVYAPPSPTPKFEPRWISYRMKVPVSGRWTLEVQEVNDDRRNGDTTCYRILVGGKPVYLRNFVDDGPGLATYFVDISATGKPYATVTLKDTSGYGMRIRSLRAYDDFEAYCRENRFMDPMLICPRILRMGKNDKIDTTQIDAWIDAFTKAGLRKNIGFCVDFAYLQKGPEYVKKLADVIGQFVLDRNVPVVIGFPTTWSFSPMNTPDGHGGKFRDIQYQQICYSKFDNYDDPGLKEYMDRCKPGWYDVHYGLSTPNHWSSVPWFTMNNKVLNGARQWGISDAIRKLNPWFAEMERRGMSGNLAGFMGEDEPVYWTKIVDVLGDGYGRVNNGVAREDLLIDFNWSVIQDAARDGVKLDPTDGLDAKEKWWLHQNPAHFNRMIARTIRGALRKPAIVINGDKFDFPKEDPGLNQYVYWVGGPGYPLNNRFHPIWDQAVFPEAGVGLGPGAPDCERARELGRVAVSDFESHGAKETESWIPNIRTMYEGGIRFSHHTNPGTPDTWGPVIQFLAHPTPENNRKRMESLLISWRRDAQTLIEETAQVKGPAAEIRQNARKLLDQGRYRDAFEEALKAKSITLPTNYRVEGEGSLWPHDIKVVGDAEITVREAGKRYCIETQSTKPFKIVVGDAVRNIPAGAHILELKT